MFDDIINQIKAIASEQVNQHPDAPAENKDGIANEAISAISEKVKSVVSSGNFSALQGLMSGNEDPKSNSTVQEIIASLTSKLTSNVGMEQGKANSLSSSLVPSIFEKAKEVFGDGKFDFKSLLSNMNLSDMIGMLKGNKGKDGEEGGGLLGKLKGLFS